MFNQRIEFASTYCWELRATGDGMCGDSGHALDKLVDVCRGQGIDRFKQASNEATRFADQNRPTAPKPPGVTTGTTHPLEFVTVRSGLRYLSISSNVNPAPAAKIPTPATMSPASDNRRAEVASSPSRVGASIAR